MLSKKLFNQMCLHGFVCVSFTIQNHTSIQWRYWLNLHTSSNKMYNQMCMHGSVIQECSDKMSKRDTNGKYDVWQFSLCCAFSNTCLWSLRWYRWLKMNWQGYGRKRLQPDILLWVVPEFYNWHSLHHISPDIMNKVSSVNSCFEMTSLAEKTEM